MKKLLLLSFALISCLFAYAQKLELGLSGGVGTNSIPKGSLLASTAKGTYNYAVSIKAFTNVKRWQFGLGIDIQPISRESDTTKFIFGDPGTSIYAMANRKLGSHFYAGLRFGLMVANNSIATKYKGNSLTPVQINYNQTTGYTGGLQIGYVKELGRRFDFNTELGLNYASTGDGTVKYTYSFYSLMIGLRLKLFNDPFRQW